MHEFYRDNPANSPLSSMKRILSVLPHSLATVHWKQGVKQSKKNYSLSRSYWIIFPKMTP